MPGYKKWVAEEILHSDDLNNYLMSQSVPQFNSEPERDAAMGPASDGQLSYVKGIGVMWYNIALPGWTILATTTVVWTNFVLLNGWVRWGLSNYADPGYRKVSGSVVELRGLAKAPANDPVICQLPVGFRPPTNKVLPAAYGIAPGITRLAISATGNVYTYDVNDVAAGQWVSFDGISFAASI